MVAESLVESIRVRDAASCRAWLARLSAVDGSRLSSVDRLLRNLSRSQEAPDLVLEIVEQARPVHLEELSGVFDRLDAGAFPLAEPDRQRFVTAVASLELGRDLYKQLHVALVDDADAAAHARIPGAAASLRAVMPLARALDYQARLLLALQRLKVIVEPNDWDELCTLARKIRASTFMDVAVPDDVPLLRSMTARALFVCPLLVMLARPETRTPAEFAVISRLARRWAPPPGANLLVSILFPEIPTPPVELTWRVGLAACAAVRAVAGVEARLKWPNDLLVDGRKLAGILAQASLTGPGGPAVVVGVGMNVRWAPEGAAQLGEGVDPLEVLASMLRELDALPADVQPEYRAALGTLGTQVRAELPGGDVVEGRAVDVEPDGRLVVLDACAITHRFDVADIVHLR